VRHADNAAAPETLRNGTLGSRGILPAAIGLALLLISGRLVVLGARGIAIALGVDQFIIGATIVALGTSTPELATILVARRRGHEEIGLGMMLGSNIFNGLLIIGLVAVIAPISVSWLETLPALIGGTLAVAITLPGRQGTIGRGRAWPLFALYAVYLISIYLMRARPG
jgi:cation:H+ antiporter